MIQWSVTGGTLRVEETEFSGKTRFQGIGEIDEFPTENHAMSFAHYIALCRALLTLNSRGAVDTGDVVDVPDPVVHIPDPMLEQAIRKETKLHPDLKITRERIARLASKRYQTKG